MSTDMQDRRTEPDGAPPTVIMQSYLAMGTVGRARLRKTGLVLLTVGVGMPMAIEPFRPLSWVYWIFAGLVAIAGLCLVWPQAGFVLLDRLVAGAARIIPAVRGAARPERRGEREDA